MREAFYRTCHRSNSLRSTRSGFSLVEVVLAVGVVAFALIALVGTLPGGLQTVRESRIQSARANITQHVRGLLNQISYDTGAGSGYDISELPGKTLYYTEDGMPTETTSDAYFEASFSLEAAKVSGGGSGTETLSINATNGCLVKVTLSYPYSIPENARNELIFALLSARQGSASSGSGNSAAITFNQGQ